jgi:uroporphyrinogen decarboxylase
MREKVISSKERALTALTHGKVDRVPIDLGGWVTTIHKKAYDNLIQLLGIPEAEKEVYDWIRQTVIPHVKLLELLEIDFRHIFPGKPNKWEYEIREENDYLEVTDEWGVKYHKPKDGGNYFDAVEGPL